MLKVNCDAAVDNNKKLMGVAIIAKDHEEKVLASMCSTKPYISNLFVPKAVAAWKMIYFVGTWVFKINFSREMRWKLFMHCRKQGVVGVGMSI